MWGAHEHRTDTDRINIRNGSNLSSTDEGWSRNGASGRRRRC
jgi:hypothetical protein